MSKLGYLITALMIASTSINAQEKIHYTGSEWADPSAHDGRLTPVVGVHNIQVMRANREKPSAANGNGWTYNHQPMLAYWNGKFYLQYLADPVGEHIPPSHTLLMTSVDGYNWTNPTVVFPEYKVPEGYTKETYKGKAHNLIAIMHQRVGFFVAKNGKLLTIGNYGVALDKKDDPNDGNGIGRVVREIKKDGTFGPIYFIYYNHNFNEKNTDFPNYKKAKDKKFVQACNELLASPLARMQWVEEADRDEPMIPLRKPYKAFNWYTLPDGRIACLWKHALTSISSDGGKTWLEPVERAKGFVNSNAKIWGQRLSDGTYATVYNPSEYRWPLAISLSSDGLEYTTLNLVHGEITPMRYGGNYKSFGPQYTRGIQEGNGVPYDKNLWVTYSVNKEDIWVSRVPVPVRLKATAHCNDNFASYKTVADMTDWNIYSPVWAPVSLKNGSLLMQDQDPFDMAKVERVIPSTKELDFSIKMKAEQTTAPFIIEFQDERGTAGSRIELTSDGKILVKGGARYANIGKYEAGKELNLSVHLTTNDRNITIYRDGKKVGLRMLFAPIRSVSRIVFRTGARFTEPTIDTPADRDTDLPRAGENDPLASFIISEVKTADPEAAQTLGNAAILRASDYKHYVDYFNTMEAEADSNQQAIPNSEAWAWMNENVPLFECSDKSLQEMYYYRWWTLRKHICLTDGGYGMTEFLVKRSYSDKWNLIACAIGHHIMESRWLRNPKYLDGIIRTWYHGNEGKPMAKMMKFSSWNPYAIYQRYLVDGKKDSLLAKRKDLTDEYYRWESTHRRSNGLYWQGDVQDGMEESISGGRRKKYARPTINSYMYGNAWALEQMANLAGDDASAKLFCQKADTIQNLINTKLWSTKLHFYETSRIDSLAGVREAIGYLPWYVNMTIPDSCNVAWKQIDDEEGFSAPFGLTTAERRHPKFRTHGEGKCEWDGAIWPFASAQTLTALANALNSSAKMPEGIGKQTFFKQMKLYVESQYRRGRPYIGEYLDEKTGRWLKDDQLRSFYYNHSTFNDLVITGIVGLRPAEGTSFVVNPLITADALDYFCLDNVLYHGHIVTVIWDKDGSRYHQGKGLSVMIDGKKAASSTSLNPLTCVIK